MSGIATKIRKEVADKMAYLQLCGSVMKEMANDQNVAMTKEFLVMLAEFIQGPSDSEIISKGPSILKIVDQLYYTASKMFPPKKPISEIARAYNKYCTDNPGYATEYGYYYGWLNDLIDCRSLYKEPIPSHSKVGAFYNAGKFVIEESIMLRDAFYFLIKAEDEMSKLNEFVKIFKDAGTEPTLKDRDKAFVYNANVGTYCRTSLLTFFSFIEAYVNGIALDHLYNYAQNLTSKEQQLLQGKDGNNYLSLEKKLEKFHMIIRKDKAQQFVTTSKQQLKEPFLTFLNDCKEIRNSSVHYSPLKARIIRQPKEWMSKATEYASVSLEVAKKFWDACYPGKKYPDYLDLLDFQILKDIAIERLNEKSN